MADIRTWWAQRSTRDKWLIGGGALLVGLLAMGEAGGAGGQINTDAGRMFTGSGQNYPSPYGNADGGGQGQGYGDQGQAGYAGYDGSGGYAAGGGYGGGGYTGGGYAGGTSAASDDPDPTGYYARQRAQDQSNQNFDNYIRDQTVVRDNDNGTVYTGVPNDVGDAAVASGGYSQVPTSELPTSSDSGSSGE